MESSQNSPMDLLSEGECDGKFTSHLKESSDRQVDLTERFRNNFWNIQRNKMEGVQLKDIMNQSEEDESPISLDCIAESLRNMVASENSKRIFIMLLLIFMVSCLTWDPNKNQSLSDVSKIIQLTCNVFFVLYFILKVLFLKEQSIFWTALDLITILCSFIGYGLTDYDVQRYFKAIRALKILFLIKQIKFLNEPATNLMTALAKVGNVLIPVLFIIYIYAVVGLYCFSDFEYSRCRTPDNEAKTSDWTVYSSEVFLCGELECPEVDGTQLKCLNPIDYQVEPNERQLINITQGNGLLKYSNIFFAFLSTIKQTFVTGSSRLIILYKQTLNPIFVQIYYYSYIYLISYIYLNIFYSLIITAEWDNEDKEEKLQSEMSSSKIKNDFQIQDNDNGQDNGQEHQLQDEKKLSNNNNNNNNNNNIEIANSQLSEIGLVMDKDEPGKFIKPKKTKIVKNFGRTSKNEDLSQADSSLQKRHSREGELVLEKTRVRNIFETVDNENIATIEGKYNDALNIIEQEVDEDATLLSEFPEKYKKYVIGNNVMIILCCLNLSLDYHGQDEDFKFGVDITDFCFYCLFMMELGVVVSMQRMFLRRVQFWTKMEILIGFVCTVGVIYEAATAKNATEFFKSEDLVADIFRSFKYLRIMILVINTPYFLEAKLILESTFKSLYNIKNVVLLWLVIVITFAIIGFHLHSYKTKVDTNNQLDMQNGTGFQISFDGTFDSVIFTVLTFYNEEWDYLMFQQYLGSGALIVIWQLISITVGLILFSKYFMALLMKELDTLIDENFKKTQDLEIAHDKGDNDETESELSHAPTNKIEPIRASERKESSKGKSVSFRLSVRNSHGTRENRAKRKTRKEEPEEKGERDGVKKCLIFFRRIIEHVAYRVVFVIMIICSCIVLISVHPHVSRDSEQIKGYLILDYICKGYFILDLILQLTVYGLFKTENSYLRKSKLNILNCVIIIIEVMSFTALGSSYIFMKVEKIKVLRVMMFLELRYKADWGMRMTYHSFVELLPKVITLLTVTILMYSYFALVLVKAYKDDFFNCVNHDSSETIITKYDCMLRGGDWVQQSMNTANLFNSVLFLFAVATMEGWISMMQPMMNLVGSGYEPVLDNNKYICLFFAFFFFFGNLIMLNVFVGLSVSNFKRLKDITTGEARLSKVEKMWLSVKSQIYRLHPLALQTRPKNPLRGLAYDIANRSVYTIIQGIFFIAFLISMSLFTTDMSEQNRLVLTRIQQFFVLILMIEFTIEFLAFGIRKEHRTSFISKAIILFYCIIYVLINLNINMAKSDERIFGGIFMALQFFRYLSILDEIPFAKKLLNSLVTILPQTSNIAILIFITLFIYAIIGMELFSFLRPNIELDSYNQNYTNFSSALFALIKFSTMESPIQQISDAAQTLSPNFVCTEIYSYEEFEQHGQIGCGNKAMSYIFFLSFHIFYSLLLMSTLMAVIVDSYSEVKREENAFITKFVLEKVRNAWSKIDPQATGYIPYREFWMFTAKLLEIYAGKDHRDKARESLNELYASREEFLKSLNLDIYENQNGVLCFQFNEVIEALTRVYIQKNIGTKIKSKKAEKMFKERQSNLNAIGFKKSFYTSSHVATLIILKSGLRWWKKVATNEKGRMQYKNVIGKFSNNKKAQDEQDEQDEEP